MIIPPWTKFIIYPALGSFLGYITNWIAITLLFRPRKKILGLQGLLEKRKKEIAYKTGQVVREYLLNTGELKKVVDKKKVKESISKLVDKTLILLPSSLRRVLSRGLREITYLYFFDKSGYIKDEILELAVSDTDLENIIAEKVMNYEISELEKIIKGATGTEITFIIMTGAVLGFLIGLIEAFIPF